jgi:DNA-binding MarR family transcriptional regulator
VADVLRGPRGRVLSLRWYDVLLHLHAAPRRRLSMRDLGRAVVISKSGLTGLVDRMQRAGLVERRPDPDDRRVIHVALTREGGDAYLQARADHRRGVREHFLRHLTAAEAGTIERSLGRIRARSRPAPAAR